MEYCFSPEGEAAGVHEQPTLQQQLQLLKESRSRGKKNITKLTLKAKAELQKREEKEVGRFLLPDAPTSKKQKRNSSPKRIPCPLVPGTPTTPPPRKRLPWEYDDDNEAGPGPSRDFGLGGYGGNEVDLISIPGPLIESSASLISDSVRPEGEAAGVHEQPTLQQQLQLLKESRSRDKKNITKLTLKAKAELQKREEKEVGRFLLPDAPTSKKQKRNSSPKRIPCPLVPGTPTTPPPRKRLPWEYDDDNEAGPGPSRDFGLGGYGGKEVDLISIPGPLIESSASLISDSVRKRKLPTEESNVGICLSPKTEYVSTNPDAEICLELGSSISSLQSTPSQSLQNLRKKLEEIDVEGFDFEHIRGIGEEQEEEREVKQAPEMLVEIDERREPSPDVTVTQGPSDDPAIFAKPSSKYVRPLRNNEMERELLNDLSGLCDSESEDEDEIDIDTMDENQCIPINLLREASNFPAHDEELPESIAQQLLENDIRDTEALHEIGDGDMLNFEWSSDPNTFCGVKETFTGEAGPTFTTEGLTPLEIFEKIFDNTMIEEIVSQTNIYAQKLLSASNLKASSRLRKWNNCTKKDIWTFIAILMLQSLMPCAVEAEYWFPKSPLFKVSDFNSLMSYSRFVLIKKCLHFVDNASILRVTGPKKKLAKIQPLINYLNNKFSSLYLPEQNIVIDESLLLWKGRLSFSQLIKNKAAQVGIKSYELCESRTGYLWQMKVYSGKGDKNASQDNINENEPQNATAQIVLNLVGPLLNKGHVLVMDNFYNSPLLSRILKKEKTDTMGTLRLNREFVPDSLKSKNKSNLQPGEVAFSHTKDLSIFIWHDSNIVSLISTFHKAAVSGKEKFGYYKYKPQVVLDYNLSMGGVDKKDQLLQAYPIERVRNQIWYKKLFRRLLNVSIHNSFIIASHNRNILHREFRKTLFLNIVTKYCTQPVINNPKSSIALGGHYPTKNSTARARCKVCSLKNKIDTRTSWKCDTCDVSLCILGCFKYYHENMYTSAP